jgi:hypothetical protein
MASPGHRLDLFSPVLTALALSAAGCTGHVRGAGDGGAITVDAAEQPGSDARPTRDGTFPGSGPVDAPPSTCDPATGCGDGGTCWQLTSGAYSCVFFQPVPGMAVTGDRCDGGLDPRVRDRDGTCCIDDSECTDRPQGRCALNPAHGGMPPAPGRHCDYTGWCTKDEDCGASSFCAPGYFGGVDEPSCITRRCRTSADCTDGPAGECVVFAVRETCTTRGYATVYCRYANDVCRVDRSGGCPHGSYCAVRSDGQGTACVPPGGSGACPP